MLQSLLSLADRSCPHQRRAWTAAAAMLLFAVPALHPLLIPLVGVPSHLLWFVHVLPVALVAYVFALPGAATAVGVSMLSVAAGEWLFGTGYGRSADRATILALATAVGSTGLLVAGFALAVRAAEARRRALELEARRSRALSEVGTLVASIAHELNNPLTSVAGFAELLRDFPEVPAAVRDDLDVMASEALRAAGIARQLLKLVRDGEQPRRPFQINDAVTLALRARAQPLAAHHIQVNTELAAGLPAVIGTAGEIEQILLNLITNAEQAMHAGAGGGRLTVRTRRDRDDVLVEVADDGPGIAPEHLSKLFNAFFTTKPAGAGTGLGLSIARRIARAHGGDLTVQSRPGAGATFLLRLPAGPVAALATPARGVRRPPSPPIGGGARRVLVIEDEPAIRETVERLLTRRGHQVRSAGDARAASAALAVEDIDTILCDVHLGPDSGLALYDSVVAQRPELRDRFVLMTGDVLSPEIREFLARTDARHLAKPFELEALLAEVEHAHAPTSAGTKARSF